MNRKVYPALILMLLLQTAGVHSATTTLNIDAWIRDDHLTGEAVRSTEISSRQNILSDDVYRTQSAFQSMDVKFDGDIKVSDDDRSIRSISPGGYLKISVRTFGNSRELLVSSNSSGELSYEFSEGRKEVPFEPEGREWLEDVLLDVVRSTGIDADDRTKRLYSAGGVDEFLNEISQISSNNVKASYFSALLDKEVLSGRELSELAYAITGKISSSTDCGRLLRQYNHLFLKDPSVAAAYFSSLSKISSSTEKGRTYRSVDQPLDLDNQELRTAYFSGVDRISSSTEQGSVLRHTIENQELSAAAQAALLRSTSKISSSTECGRVLRSLDPDMHDPRVIQEYFRTVDLISSSTEAGASLRHVLSGNKVEGDAMISLLLSTKKISSSTETGSVIRSIREINLNDPGIREAYFNVIRTTSSSTEAGRMLRFTLDNHRLNQAAMINLYETNKRISSDTEVSSVLRTSIPRIIYEPAVMNAFFECTNRLSSSTEHGRVLRELARTGELPREAIEGILMSAQGISSSTEKGSVLRTVAPRIPEGDKALREVYMETARTLSSDTEFRRATDAIM